MIYLALDFETTGVDPINDRVIEAGAVLYSTGQKKCLEYQGMLVKSDKIVSPFIQRLTGIHPVAIEKFGYDDDTVLDIILDMANNADAYLGYNIRRFDIKVLKEWAKRRGREIPERLVIDVFADLPWRVPMSTLQHTLADHHLLNYFEHSALGDALSTILLSQQYDADLLAQRAGSPTVVLRSHQGRGENDLVKAAPFRFRWNPDNDKKFWWKPAKQQDVDEIIKEAPFQITIENGWTVEELEN